jgi:lysophospholipid acyltransferase (LPLAT)-like uncharacterized protein
MEYSRKEKLILALIPFLHRLLSLWFGTCRVRILRPDLHEEYFLGERPFIGVTWHRSTIFSCYYFGAFHPLVLFSQSPDGEYMARFAERCGMVPVRGSSTRGGERALIQMIRALREGRRICATVLDGPQGPPYQAKAGFLFLAKKTGLPLIPLIWSSAKAITLESTWDKTMIPRPFSEVVVQYGDPLWVPADCSEEALETLRREVEGRLNRIMVEVDQYCGYPTRWG